MEDLKIRSLKNLWISLSIIKIYINHKFNKIDIILQVNLAYL